ncbi:MAG: amino acid permease [Chlamydiae bacterium]|jgi:putative glutamate/gamma-aminobutyrate antiporter|nr:amino acid permease [Chlamydiota bacterium]
MSKKINVFVLTMINIATILSIRNWPISAQYGLSSVVFLSLALIFFFIPAAMVSAELATGWPQKGGVFVWVKEALGHRMGFLAVWLLWLENVVWYPTILSFVAATIAYIVNPSLNGNKWYTFLVIISIFWLVTFVNLKGIKIYGWISSVAASLGTLFPGLLIICLGFAWIAFGNPSHIEFSLDSLKPNLTHFSDLAFLAGILLSFGGIEMSAVHAKDVENPQKNYSKAIFFSALVIVILTILGTLAISIIIPKNNINLISGSIEAIYNFFELFGLQKFIPVIAGLVVIGSLGGVSTWAAGPCRGLLAAAEKGDFPPLMQKVNRHDMPINVMIIQAVIVTLLSFAFIFMPNVSSSFWILTILAAQLYTIMYLLMFISGIVLRYKKREVQRHYKVPFGNAGMWIISSMGILGSLFTFFIGFVPPSPVDTGGLLFFELFLVIGLAIFCAAPLVIFQLRHLWAHKSQEQAKLK